MIKDRLSSLFGYPIGNMSFRSYFEFLNGSGKITARSLMDISAIILESIQELEDKDLVPYSEINERRVDKKERKS